MKIDTVVANELNIVNYDIKGRFYSRRNKVYHIGAYLQDGNHMDFIYKVYVSGDLEREYTNLIVLNGKSVPKVITRDKSALCLEYIRGRNLLELLEEMEWHNAPFHVYINMLVDFLYRFYSAVPGFKYGDVNLRNFIVTNQGVYGVDLEDMGPGSRVVDISSIAAFLLTYNPAFTNYKKIAAKYFLDCCTERFNIDKRLIEKEKEKEIENIMLRRKQKFVKI